MPLAARRAQRAGALWKSYIQNHKGRHRRALLRRRAAARARQANPAPRTSLFGVDLDFGASSSSDSSTSSDSSSSSSDTSSDDSWSDILGPNWRYISDISVDGEYSITGLTTSTTSSNPSGMPELLSVGSDSSSSNSSSDSGWSWSSGAEGDDEDSGDSADEDTADQRPFLLRRWIQSEIDDMYQNRYEQPRDTLPRGPSYLHHVLMALKAGRPDHFRQNLRVSPITFDALVAALEHDPVFTNNSNNPHIRKHLFTR
ncbi:hypothetical protein GGX14DRAFT_404899 [Mycena pura]|uniref:Uncharacterized protein n=1 Tax=Mycena pura TaxID=153505 RepID=A0AAD6UTJ2_9AGAR|nr:hypothetical protein GGX14DRAFT_404899 [Mycena pura]